MDGGVLFEPLLDGVGIDVLAGAHEHVVYSAHEEVPAVGVAGHQIAGVVPAVGEALGVHVGQVVVAGHHAGGAHPQLARVGVLAGGGVDQPQLHLGVAVAHGDLGPRLAVGMRAELEHGLGGAVAVRHHRVGQQALHVVVQRFGERGRADERTLHRGQVGHGLACGDTGGNLGGDEGEHGGHARAHGDAVLGDGVDVPRGGEARQQHHGSAVDERQLGRHRGVLVVQRRGHQHHLAGHRCAVLGDGKGDVPMREQDALGSAGGA